MTCLSPVHTVGNQMVEAIKLYHPTISKTQAREYAISLLMDVGLNSPEKQIDSYVFELSGGMRQRALIAIALSGEPKIIIADEPTTAIDVTIQARILNILYEIKEKKGLSIIIITHNMGVVAQLTDDTAVMYMGIIVERGSTKEIFHNPQHPYTKKLLDSIPGRIDSHKSPLKTIEGEMPDPYKLMDECPFRNRCEHKNLCDEGCIPELKEVNKGHFVRCFLC